MLSVYVDVKASSDKVIRFLSTGQKASDAVFHRYARSRVADAGITVLQVPENLVTYNKYMNGKRVNRNKAQCS